MIYLDNCSTTKPREEVIRIISKSLEEDFGNPSSLHRLGMNAEKKIKNSREIISNFLGVNSNEIYFTSGGTESNNIAIQSMVNKLFKRGNHIITTKIEHPSVLNIMKDYETKGFNIEYLDVDHDGNINLQDLENSINDNTILVAIMQVNNEIGNIEPISQINNIIRKNSSKALFHVDGVQGFGKVKIDLRSSGVDSYSFSSHKIHGPKGIGGLYIDKKHSLLPIIYGGNQERGIRSGTENLTGIIGFAEALRIMKENYDIEIKSVKNLKDYFLNKISNEIDDIRINTPKDSSPYILNISFRNVRGEVLLHYLEDKGIYVSTSSACSSNVKDKSYVLEAIGLNNIEIEGTIRFCFSYENTMDDMDYTIKVLKQSVSEIRQIILR